MSVSGVYMRFNVVKRNKLQVLMGILLTGLCPKIVMPNLVGQTIIIYEAKSGG